MSNLQQGKYGLKYLESPFKMRTDNVKSSRWSNQRMTSRICSTSRIRILDHENPEFCFNFVTLDLQFCVLNPHLFWWSPDVAPSIPGCSCSRNPHLDSWNSHFYDGITKKSPRCLSWGRWWDTKLAGRIHGHYIALWHLENRSVLPIAQMLHVWNLHLHLPQTWSKCR